jgi:PKD repeat protein
LYSENGRYDVSLTVTDINGGTNTLTREGYILVTDIFLMKDTTVYLCDGLFYDSGGEAFNYNDNEDYTITFVSLLESGSLEVVFHEFEIEDETDCASDFLEVYDGMGIDAPLIGKYCGTNIPNSITAHNINGALTFRFISNEEVNLPGWKAFITCDTSVGIFEFEDDRIAIYPNPATDHFTIESDTPIDIVALYNMAGKLIMQIQPENTQQFLSTENLKGGIYLVRIETNGKVYNKKLILR